MQQAIQRMYSMTSVVHCYLPLHRLHHRFHADVSDTLSSRLAGFLRCFTVHEVNCVPFHTADACGNSESATGAGEGGLPLLEFELLSKTYMLQIQSMQPPTLAEARRRTCARVDEGLHTSQCKSHAPVRTSADNHVLGILAALCTCCS